MSSPSIASDQESFRNPAAVQALATAFVALFSIVGLALWGLPFFYDFMVRQFSWSRAEVTSGNAISKLVVGPLFGFFAGWIVDRFGPRRLMILGVVLAGVGVAGLGSVSTLPMFYLFYFFNALGYVCGGPLPNQVLLSRWFSKSRGKAMGIAYLGIGCGGAAAPLVSHALAQQFGWQTALRILGLTIIVLTLPMAFFLKESPATTPMAVLPIMGVKETFKSRSFYLLAFGSMCSIAAVSGTQQNLKLFFSLDQHFSQSEAARVISLVLTFSIVGRLLMGWLADRIATKYVMLLIYLLVAASIPLLFLTPAKAPLYGFAALFGIGLGGDYMIIPLMAVEIFGIKVLGRLLGVILTADGMAEAVSPWVVGHLRDLSGSYSSGFAALIGMALLGALAISALPKAPKLG